MNTKRTNSPFCSFEPGAKQYSLQTIELQSGDTLFLASDGFVDQFGGPRGKIMRRRFRELLIETSAMPSMSMNRTCSIDLKHGAETKSKWMTCWC